MKKLLLLMVVILAAVYASLAMLGSGGEYAAEKLFYHTMKNASRISLNPDAAPPAQLASVENDLLRLIAKYPGTRVSKLGHVALVEFYIANKRYDEARKVADTISKTYEKDTDILSTVQFLRGTMYQKEGKWDKALAEFRILNKKYPATQLGMEIPIYIGKYYESTGSYQKADEAYKEAAAFYSKMQEEYSGKVLGYTASLFLIQTYINLEDYGSAGNALDTTLHTYVSRISIVQLMPLVDRIYVQNLNDPAKAIETYKYMITKANNSRLRKFLTKKIEELEKNK